LGLRAKGRGMHDVHGRELRWKGCTMCMEGSGAGRREKWGMGETESGRDGEGDYLNFTNFLRKVWVGVFIRMK